MAWRHFSMISRGPGGPPFKTAAITRAFSAFLFFLGGLGHAVGFERFKHLGVPLHRGEQVVLLGQVAFSWRGDHVRFHPRHISSCTVRLPTMLLGAVPIAPTRAEAPPARTGALEARTVTKSRQLYCGRVHESFSLCPLEQALDFAGGVPSIFSAEGPWAGRAWS